MAIVSTNDPQSEKLVGELLTRANALNEEYQIQLSPYAEALLQLTAEAWVNDPPLPSVEVAVGSGVEIEVDAPNFDVYPPVEAIERYGRDDWFDKALQAYEVALNDERIQRLLRAGQAISYPILFHALADAGMQMDWGFK